MKIVMRDPAELIPAEYNPRKLSNKQKEDIKASLTEFGFADPIVVNKHKDRLDIIIGGHQRCLVAQEMGTEKVPTVEMNITLEKEKELNIRLNKNSGEFDFDLLDEFFDTDDLINWGFDEVELGLDVDEEEKEITDLSDDLNLEYKLEIELENEDQQESLYNKLTEEGYKCRILTL